MTSLLSAILICGVFLASSDAAITTEGPEECPAIYDRVGGRCITVDANISGTWREIHYRCQQMGGVMVEIETPNFFYDVIQYLKQQLGESTRSYWIGGTKDAGIESPYLWNSTGLPLPEGSPFWTIDSDRSSSYYDDDEYYAQEPWEIEEAQFVYLNGDRFLFFSSGSEDEITASAICQRA